VVKTILLNKNGVPDIIACIRGKFIAIEVKRVGCKPTELQLYNKREIERAGGLAYIVYDLKEVEQLTELLKA